MKSYILTVAALALLSNITIAEDKPAGGPAGGKPEGERKRGPGGPGGERHFPSAEERLKRMTEHLGLTQEQQDKIKAIFAKTEGELKALHDKGRDNLTEEDKTKFRDAMKAQFEEIGNVLTPEQKEKMKKAREERGGGEGHRRGGPGAKPGEGKPGEGAKPAPAN